MKDGQKFRHKGNGEIYQVVLIEEFEDFSIKQSSENEWENPVIYQNVETLQTHITGEKRFKERFEAVE